MMKKILLSLAAIATLQISQAQEVKVHTIGDSTMADYNENTTFTRGWGEMFQEFFNDDLQVINYARGGRSSRSFCQEGLWDKVKSNITPGDYVFIQFAHNDEKEGGVDGADGRGTAPWTTYKSYLEKYVDETRQLNGLYLDLDTYNLDFRMNRIRVMKQSLYLLVYTSPYLTSFRNDSHQN